MQFYAQKVTCCLKKMQIGVLVVAFITKSSYYALCYIFVPTIFGRKVTIII